MPQRDLLLPWRRALANATLGAEVSGRDLAEAEATARGLFERFGLAGFEEAWPSELSGGMRQRLALLRTFLQGRDVLLLDEPFGALDALTRRRMYAWLEEVWLADRRTVLFVTHDVEEAISLSGPRAGAVGAAGPRRGGARGARAPAAPARRRHRALVHRRQARPAPGPGPPLTPCSGCEKRRWATFRPRTWRGYAVVGQTAAVDVSEHLDAPCPPELLFAWVEDLTTYPSWLDIVPRAAPADAVEGDDALPAWTVELRGRLGPLARSKRLRMVRTRHEAPHQVTFKRREVDGRSHSPWVLRAEVEPTVDGSRLTMHLHYGGGMWGSVLERLLGDEIGQAAPGCSTAWRAVAPSPTDAHGRGDPRCRATGGSAELR